MQSVQYKKYPSQTSLAGIENTPLRLVCVLQKTRLSDQSVQFRKHPCQTSLTGIEITPLRLVCIVYKTPLSDQSVQYRKHPSQTSLAGMENNPIRLVCIELSDSCLCTPQLVSCCFQTDVIICKRMTINIKNHYFLLFQHIYLMVFCVLHMVNIKTFKKQTLNSNSPLLLQNSTIIRLRNAR